MLLCELSTGDMVNRFDRLILINFSHPRKVLSTSVLNGAYREDLTAVFNYDCYTGNHTQCRLRAPTFEEHMRLEAHDLGLNPDTVTGIETAAQMENAGIVSKKYNDLTVTAIATAGVEVNGGRVGDPTDNFLPVDKNELYKPGTINIILVIDADMPSGAMARALVTCTEAKTAALQELMAGSNYSNGLATGSGTDQTIIIANPASLLYFEWAGKHSKLGELIGNVVISAVKEALLRQTGLSPQMQHSALRRLKRFGINEDTLWKEFEWEYGGQASQTQFINHLRRIDRDWQLVTYTSLFVHLLDQMIWKLLASEESRKAGSEILALMARNFSVPAPSISGNEIQDYLQAWSRLMVSTIKNLL